MKTLGNQRMSRKTPIRKADDLDEAFQVVLQATERINPESPDPVVRSVYRIIWVVEQAMRHRFDDELEAISNFCRERLATKAGREIKDFA